MPALSSINVMFLSAALKPDWRFTDLHRKQRPDHRYCPNGTPLVTGGQSFQLTSQANSSGHQDVFAGGTDITSQITSGALAGYIQVRDPNDSRHLSNLDTLAAGLANGVNAANQSGYDLNGNPQAGTFLFRRRLQGLALPPICRSRSQIPQLIAASSDGTA